MNATNAKHRRRFGLLMMVAVLLAPLALSTPASADHKFRITWGGWNSDWSWNRGHNKERYHRGHRDGYHRSRDGYHRSRDGYRHRDVKPAKKSEYHRGADLARKDGRKNGYWDGYSGKPRCGKPTRDLGCRTRGFVKGYLDNYYENYCAGFRQGRQARRLQRTCGGY